MKYQGFAAAILVILLWGMAVPVSASLPVLRGIGGEFTAMSTLGHEISLEDFRDRPLLIFFGYSNCSDICPATLGHLSSLTSDGKVEVQVLFVSIDPDYDTPTHLKAYLDHFDSDYIGISDREQTDRIVGLFKARYKRVGDRPLSTAFKKLKVKKTDGDGDSAFLYSHSASIYLLDKQGRVRATYFNGTPISQMKSDIQTLNNE